jgi:PKD repeat protein
MGGKELFRIIPVHSWDRQTAGHLLLRLLVAVILIGTLFTPALGAVISGHVYTGNPGDYSRPLSSVRILIVPSNEPDSYYPSNIQANAYTDGSGFYQFQFTPKYLPQDPDCSQTRDGCPQYYFIVLFNPPGSIPAGARSPSGTVTSPAWIRIPFPSSTSSMTGNDFWIIYPPVAGFTMNPQSSMGVVPLTVSFTDRSTGDPSAWLWNFGDGQASSSRNPSHTYTSPGKYTFTLTTSNAAGSSTTGGTVTVIPKPVLTLSPSSGRAGTQVTVTGSSFNLYGVEFPSATLSFNGVMITGNVPMTRSGNLASKQSVPLGSFTTSFTVPAGTPPGTYTVRAVGPLDSATASFTVVNTPPEARIDALPRSGQGPLPVHFSGTRSYDEDGSITSYQWDFGDGSSATGVEVDHTYTRSGDYRARLTVTDDQGASGTSYVTISLENIPPVAVARANPTSGSDPLTVNFDGSQSYDPDGTIVSYHWDFGDGYWERTTRASHQYRSPQSYTAVLTVTDDKRMEGKAEVVITVGNKPPVAAIAVSPQKGTAPLTVTLDGSQSSDPDDADLSFSWDFGDGARGGGRVVTHTYEREGTFQVSLEVTDPHGATGRASATVTVVRAFPLWPVVIGGLGAVAGVGIYRGWPRVKGPGDCLPEDCKYPEPSVRCDVRSGVECELGDTSGLPDFSVDIRSGIWKEEMR